MTELAQATARYVADFERFAGNGAAGAPAWLKQLRRSAIARFAELGFPTMKQEEWRLTSVAPIVEKPFALARAAGHEALRARDIDRFVEAATAGRRVVFVNGRYVPALSAPGGLPGGVTALGLAEACRRHPDLVRRHLGRYAGDARNAFTALNTAFLDDGAFVHVPAGVTVPEPLHLVFVAAPGPGDEPPVAHPRNLVVIERGASAAVVESYVALSDGVYWTNAVTELALEEGARLEHCRVQHESGGAYHVAATHAHLARDAALDLHPVALGGALSRHDVRTVLDGPGGTLVLNGLYLLGGAQHADHHTVIDHAQPHCESHEYFNGVLADRAHGVFNGRIIVRPGAQRTDSKQTNHNLLLSAAARADSQPQLEIYADDVKCTHGSTVGPIDEVQLFYLRSRGLSLEAARGLLTYGFGVEILGRVRAAEVRAHLDALVRAWLAGSGERSKAA